MAVNLSPVFNDTQFTNAGALAVGYKIYTYIAGSSTPLTTYTSATGLIAQANPIILNARGECDDPIWLTEGLSYRLRLFTDADVFTGLEFDNITGVGDSSLTIDQWVDVGLTPTYVSATSFTLAGDQTSTFTIGRRVKSTVTAGTAYSTIISSVFGALTTVTVVNDAGSALDSGLSAVALGIITPNNTSFPLGIANQKVTSTGTAPTYVVTLVPPLTTYSTMPRVTVQFHSSNGSVATTMNINALGAKSLKQLDGSGAKIDPVIISGQLSDIEYDGTDLILLDSLPQSSQYILNRNCIQYGPQTAAGQPDIIPQSQVGNTNAAGVTLIAPFYASAANGVNADGTPKNFNRYRSTNLNIPNLTNSTSGMVIWYDPVSDTAGFSPPSVGGVPLFQYGGTIPVTNNQYTYDYLNNILYLGNGSVATAVTRVLIAAVSTSATNVTNIVFTYGGATVATAGNLPYNSAYKGQITELDYRALSGTTQDWQVPSWARRIIFNFVGLSTTGTSIPIIQLGDSGGIETTGYLGAASFCGATTNGANFTTGMGFTGVHAAANVYHGRYVLELADLTTNTWTGTMQGGYSNNAFTIQAGSSKPLSQPITTLRITTVGGADTFDAGSAKVSFEG